MVAYYGKLKRIQDLNCETYKVFKDAENVNSRVQDSQNDADR